jgi:c-di-GMP-binding flagellar brake protein YcgR
VVRVDTEHRLGLAVQFTQISEQSKEAIQANVYELRMEAALKAA